MEVHCCITLDTSRSILIEFVFLIIIQIEIFKLIFSRNFLLDK